ncbi:MAG: dihydroorotase, partial [Sphingomonadales bacterium]
MADSLTIRRPDDWHVHLRDGAMLQGVAAYTARQFGRAIVMPNLSPPVTTTAAAQAYRGRIMAALPDGASFEPLMTAYLTDHTDPANLARGKAEGVLTAAKLYPANATTNSAHGVSDIARLDSVFAAMEEAGLVLCIHGEVTDPE